MIEGTLLERFIREQVESYQEPPRKGVKGNPPGRISKQKFEAALLQLSNNSQLHIAKTVGVSHALVLKWRTEKPFQTLAGNLLNEFTYLFWKHIHQIGSKFQPGIIPENELLNIGDVSNYSDHLILSIFDFLWRVRRDELLCRGWPVFWIFKDVLFSSLADRCNNLLRIYILYFRFEALFYIQAKVGSGKSDKLSKFLLSILLQHLMLKQYGAFKDLHRETQTQEIVSDEFVDRIQKKLGVVCGDSNLGNVEDHGKRKKRRDLIPGGSVAE